MKKLFAFLVSLAIILLIFWPDKEIILAKTDEFVSKVIEYFQDDIEEHDAFEDLNSGKYFSGNSFLLMDYAKDLGYYQISFPKRPETIAILRRGEKKIVIKNEEIILYSYGDKFEEGLSLRLYSDEEGDYYLDYGEEKTEQRVSKDVILDLATALIHLRDSDSLMDMALENRGDSEKFIKNPSILELP